MAAHNDARDLHGDARRDDTAQKADWRKPGLTATTLANNTATTNNTKTKNPNSTQNAHAWYHYFWW
jgi:hypothetical protein